MTESSVIVKFFKMFINAFEHSVIKRLFNMNESKVISALKRHIKKDSAFKYSLVYKIIMRIVSALDVIASAVWDFFTKLSQNSQTAEFFKHSKKMKLSVFTLFFASAAFTYTILCIIMSKSVNLAVLGVCFVLLVLSFLETNLKKLSKTSFTVCFIEKLFED